MFMILVGYPSEAEELEIISRTTSGHTHLVQRVLGEAEIQGMQELVCKIPASPHVVKYAMDIVRKAARIVIKNLLPLFQILCGNIFLGVRGPELGKPW